MSNASVNVHQITLNALRDYADETDLTDQVMVDVMRKTVYGAFVGENLVGVALMLNNTGHLDALHVLPSYRRQKVATTLLEALDVTGVMVEKDNVAAMALDEGLEFRRCSCFGKIEHLERDLI